MRTVIKVSNITCSQCAKTIERFFATKDDVIAKVHVTAKKVIFDYNSAKTSVNDLVKGLQEIGYYPLITSIDQKKAKRRDLIDFIIATLCTIPLLWTMIGHFGGSDLVPEFLQNGYVQLAFVIPVEFFVGRRFFKAAYYQLSAKTAGMDVLVVIGTMAAFTYSLFLTINHQLHPTEMPPHLYFEAAAVIIYMV
ncbi:MAG: heavy metal translocating P-type ATPase, partial [Erysipelotrichaceae bacterium]|nr:heavy metal translocating P-type ATPase [Erysipelotrichaceae bacterium]